MIKFIPLERQQFGLSPVQLSRLRKYFLCKMETKKLTELKSMAKEAKIPGYSKMSKSELISSLSCEGGQCKISLPDPETKLETVSEDAKPHPKPERKKIAKRSRSESPIDLDSLLKKVTKQQLMTYATKLNVQNGQKLSKEHLMDAIIEKAVSNLISDIISTIE